MHSMPALHEFVGNFLVIVVASVAVLLASHRLRLPPIVGFLVTGMLIGPSGLALIGQDEVEVLAEIGVVLLLFTVGLEYSLQHMRARWRPLVIGGGLQVGLTTALTLVVALAAHASWRAGLFLGFLAALSSTAIVLKAYADRRELQSPQGSLVTSILLFQDISLAPMIVLVPVLAGSGSQSPGAVLVRVVAAALVVLVSVVVARHVMPPLLHWIVRTRVREVFVLCALGICLGLGMLTDRLGFSMALGAFLAGLVLSETEYRHQVAAEVLPFRDLLNGLFFISLGMLLRFAVVREHALLVLAIAVALVAGKAATGALAVALLGYPARTAWITGWSLAQVGEFSFVLGGVGLSRGLLDPIVYQVFLAASIVTMLAAPLWIGLAPRWAGSGGRLPVLDAISKLARGGMAATEARGDAPRAGHVVLVGYGLNGRNVARVLRETAIPFVVLEMNPTLVLEARRAGVSVMWGDATRSEVLEACHIGTAGMIVLAISDPAATREAVRIARRANRDLFILARTRAVGEVDELLQLGADEVIPEEFETSIEIFCRVLERHHIPRNVIDAQVQIIRDEAYGMLRDASRPATAALSRLTAILEGTLTDTYLVLPGSRADGASLEELDLRRTTGASVIALVRGGVPSTNPTPGTRLQAHDTLVLVGDHAALEAAGRLLTEPPMAAETDAVERAPDPL